jgi:hypothetical protein
MYFQTLNNYTHKELQAPKNILMKDWVVE